MNKQASSSGVNTTRNTSRFVPSLSDNVKLAKKVQELSYTPSDVLEEWLFDHSVVGDQNLLFKNPTHISQRGACYHISGIQSQKTFEEYIKVWSEAITKKQTFYMEEIRPFNNFKLYLDLDFKLKENTAFNLSKSPWLKYLMQFTMEFFSSRNKSDFSCCITYCNGPYASDTTTPDCKYKSGFRLYFSGIRVQNNEEFSLYLSKLIEYLEQNHCTQYPNKAQNWHVTDIVDTTCAKYPRCRMFGSEKLRNGKDLSRQYKFYGCFNEQGELDTTETELNKKSLYRLLASVSQFSAFLV